MGETQNLALHGKITFWSPNGYRYHHEKFDNIPVILIA